MGINYTKIHFSIKAKARVISIKIGNHLGLAHETVSRLFNSFQVKNMIEVQLRLVKIIDKKKLLNVINQETV